MPTFVILVIERKHSALVRWELIGIFLDSAFFAGTWSPILAAVKKGGHPLGAFALFLPAMEELAVALAGGIQGSNIEATVTAVGRVDPHRPSMTV
jgi:hypothetical protein